MAKKPKPSALDKIIDTGAKALDTVEEALNPKTDAAGAVREEFKKATPKPDSKPDTNNYTLPEDFLDTKPAKKKPFPKA